MIEKSWGVQLDDEGSMDLYDSEQEAREHARGCPIWEITSVLLQDGNAADRVHTDGSMK